jgi:hypothetical protein
MLEKLSNYPTIVVTGPQRSGTRINAKIIAEELGYKYVDEEAFGFRDEEKFRALLQPSTVIQAPGLAHIAHTLPANVLVVYMHRDIDDILTSQARIKWPEWSEQQERERCPIKDNARPVAALKYEHWDSVKTGAGAFIDLPYEYFSQHRLWVKDTDRKDFQWNQTS